MDVGLDEACKEELFSTCKVATFVAAVDGSPVSETVPIQYLGRKLYLRDALSFTAGPNTLMVLRGATSAAPTGWLSEDPTRFLRVPYLYTAISCRVQILHGLEVSIQHTKVEYNLAQSEPLDSIDRLIRDLCSSDADRGLVRLIASRQKLI